MEITHDKNKNKDLYSSPYTTLIRLLTYAAKNKYICSTVQK